MAGNRVSIGQGCALLLAAVLAAPLSAQSANDFRLPGATGTPTSRAAGPVDPTDPTSTVPRARPSATPSPEPSASTPAPSPSATPSAAPRAVQPRPAATRAAAPVIAPPVPQPAADTPAPQPSETVTPASPSPTAEPIPQPSLPPAEGAFDWRPWAGGALALLAAIGALLWWRRRKPGAPEAEYEPEEAAPVAVEPAPAPSPAPSPAPPSPPPAPAFALPASALELTLEAKRLTASLMATSLSYALRLTNTGTVPLAALAVEADLVSAHASLPVERQIASDSHRLELRHAQVELAPGESVEFTGDLRLPLTEVTPIRAGGAAYFVPLARFRVEAGDQVLVQTYVIGELPEQTGGALRPFRLDLGPRTYSQVGQRAVA